MTSALPAAVLLLLALTGTNGLQCIGCRPNRQIAGVSFPPALEKVINRFPRCSQLNPKDPSLEFEMKCDSKFGSCAKIRDEHGNELRTCYPGTSTGCSKATKKGQTFCKCRGDFCNSADASTPALLSLFVPLAAALLRLH